MQIFAPWFLRGENSLMGYGNELLEIVSLIEGFFSKPIRSLDNSVI